MWNLQHIKAEIRYLVHNLLIFFRERNNSLTTVSVSHVMVVKVITCVYIQICLRHVGTKMLSQLVLVQVAITCVSHGTVSDSFSKVVEEGQDLTGKLGAQLKTRTKIECSAKLVRFEIFQRGLPKWLNGSAQYSDFFRTQRLNI